MKVFIRKVFSFILLYIAFSLIITSFTPFHWGNPWFSTKFQFLEKKENSFNTFFFGSSRVYRQIDPAIFDKTFNLNNEQKINSFNLGAPATFTPQTYYLYEEFLETELANDAEYCFIELMEIDLLSDFFMHQERTTYWQNTSDLLFVNQSLFHQDRIGYRRKVKSSINYLVSFLENILHLGHFGQQLTNGKYYDKRYLGSSKNGFFPLEYDYSTTDDYELKEHLFQRKNSILNDTTLIKKRAEGVLNAYNSDLDGYDSIHLERIKKLIDASEEKGIHLIFILSPRNASQNLIAMSRQIPQAHFIDMANPHVYPNLYESENSFDTGHLNTKGADEYSRQLAVELAKIQNFTLTNEPVSADY